MERASAAAVSAARGLLAGRVGVLEAARNIGSQVHTLDPELVDEALRTFLGIDSESDRIAVGPVLDAWHPSLRAAKAREAADFEAFYRAPALKAAARLVERFAPTAERGAAADRAAGA